MIGDSLVLGFARQGMIPAVQADNGMRFDGEGDAGWTRPPARDVICCVAAQAGAELTVTVRVGEAGEGEGHWQASIVICWIPSAIGINPP